MSEQIQPDNSWRFREWFFLALGLVLASHGLVSILEGCGVIVWYGGKPHFWFEEAVRAWIAGGKR